MAFLLWEWILSGIWCGRGWMSTRAWRENSTMSLSQPPRCRSAACDGGVAGGLHPECGLAMFALLSSFRRDRGSPARLERKCGCIADLTKPQHRLVLVELQGTKPTLVMGPSACMCPRFGSAGHASAMSPPLLWWLCACFPYESLPGESDFSREILGAAENRVFIVSFIPVISDWNLWCLGSILAFPSTGQDGFHLSCYLLAVDPCPACPSGEPDWVQGRGYWGLTCWRSSWILAVHCKAFLSLPPLELKEQWREAWTAPRCCLESCGPQILYVRSTVCAVPSWRSSLKSDYFIMLRYTDVYLHSSSGEC